MYCRNCYCKLDETAAIPQCGFCGREFKPLEPRTYLERPFPSKSRILMQLVTTAAASIFVAYVVALFQMGPIGGH